MRSVYLVLCISVVSCRKDFFVDPACPDYELSLICTSLCETDFIKCAESCGENECLLTCNREFASCNDACPCHTDCLDGCTDCENLICSCNDNTNDKNLDACAAEQSSILGNCTLGCNGETDCQFACLETFETNYSNCPCQKHCPFGCPCPEYECKIKKEMAILVLSTQQSTNKPVLLLQNGGVDNNLEFELGESTEVYHSCSAILNDQMYVFGGSIETKQISKVNGCELQRIDDLSFEFYWGACGTYKFPDERIMLCFAKSAKATCQRFYDYQNFHNPRNIIINLSYDGQNFHQHGNSSTEHYGTSLANINGAPLVVGGSSPRTNKAEQFDISTDTWVRVDAYFFSDFVFNYGTGITTKNGAIIAGGSISDGAGGSTSSTIVAAYNDYGWIKIGDLHSTRNAFRMIQNDDKVYVIGGNPGHDKSTEIWSLDEESFVIKLAEPRLTGYNGFPELWLVDRNFCVIK